MIGSNIRRLRKSRGIRQDELASRVGVSDAAVSSWEVGRTEPSISMIKKICTVLHCTMSEIIEDVGVPGVYVSINLDTAIDELSDISGLIDETIERLKAIRNKYREDK